MRKVIRSFGLALILWGLVLIFIGQVSITGFVIVGDLNFEWRFVLGLVLVVGGVLILAFTRERVGGLERQTDSVPNEMRVFISSQALARQKDKTIRSKWGQYMHEINMIKANPHARPQERIGEFAVSPRGSKQIRVAWHYDKQNN